MYYLLILIKFFLLKKFLPFHESVSVMGRKNNSQKPAEAKKLTQAKRLELNLLVQRLSGIDMDRKLNNQELWAEYLELKKIVDQIQLIENDLKVRSGGSGGDRMKHMPTFRRWVTDHGGIIDNIDVVEFPGYGLGLQAQKAFKKDDAMITIPRKLFMSLDNPKLLAEPYLTQIPLPPTMNVKLALWLIQERLDANSFYKPYIDILPERIPHFLQYTVAEMQELKGSCALAYTINQYRGNVRMYAIMYNLIRKSTHPSLEMIRQRFTFELYR